jgi:hypothetical protein
MDVDLFCEYLRRRGIGDGKAEPRVLRAISLPLPPTMARKGRK